MANGITYVNIFLASSLNDLHEDRLALGDYVRKLNDIYIERGVFFRLFICEDEDIAMADGRKQEEYNQKLRESQLCFVIFFNRAGEYTLEEFETAYQRFKEVGSPAIVTCFKQGEGYAPEQGVLDFMKRLDKELGHYFKVYDHIDSLKLALLMQVKLMELDVPVEFKDGKALVGGVEAMTLDNVSAFVKNADFQRLRAEYETLDREFQAARARYLANPEDDDGFLAAGERRKKAKDALEELERHLYELLLGAAKGSKEKLTARQREAYALVEQGKMREADAILDEEEILAEAAHKEALANTAKESIAQNVAELLQKIGIVLGLVEDETRFDRVIRLYEEAVTLEERNGLKKTAMWEYCDYLWRQREYKRAGYWMERYKKHMELDGEAKDIAAAANQLGLLYSDTGRMAEAEAEYRRAKEIRERLAAENPGAYLPDLAATCNSLGILYSDTGRMAEAEAECLRAKGVYEQLAAENPGAYLPDVAMTCNNLGILYKDTDRMAEAEAEYLRAKGVYEQLAAENPGAYLPDVAMTCYNLGNLYKNTGRMADMEAKYLRAKGVYERLAEVYPRAYLPRLINVYSNLTIFYDEEMGDLERAIPMLEKMKALKARLDALNKGDD